MNKGLLRRGLFALVFCTAAQAQAGGWTNLATPTGFDFVTAGIPGIMVYGAFGNPNGCTFTDRFFVPKAGNEQQYTQIVAALMTANAAGRQVQAYINTCTDHLWYSSPGTTFNQLVGTSLQFRD